MLAHEPIENHPRTSLGRTCARWTLAAWFASAGALQSCAAEVGHEPESEPEVAAATEAIINGTPASNLLNGRGGFVALSRFEGGVEKVFCSGTLISNSEVITAKHCLTASNTAHLQQNPHLLHITMGRVGGQFQNRTATTIWFTKPSSFRDFAVIEVSSPFTMPRNSDGVLSTSGYSRGITTVAAGVPVVCPGYGFNTQTCDSAGNNCTGSGHGTLRTGQFVSEIVNGSFYRYHPNPLGQISAKGDSGSGCVTVPPAGTTYAQQPIVSVMSQCFRAGSTNSGAFCNAEPAVFALFEAWDIVTP